MAGEGGERGQLGIVHRRHGRAGPMPDGPLELDLEVFFLELELRQGVLLHQIDDRLDLFQVHGSVLFLRGAGRGPNAFRFVGNEGQGILTKFVTEPKASKSGGS